MIPTSFDYKKATSISDALASLNGDAKILAGGHSLIPAMKLRLNQPATLVDITGIAELKGITDGGDKLIIGANATHHDIVDSDLVKAHCGMLSQGGDMIGDIQVRNKGTIGGSIAHADPAADWPAMLIASGATIRVQNSGGSRDISADDFFTGFYETALKDDEIITEIHVPKQGADTVGVYVKFPQPASRFAIVGVAALLTHSGGNCSDVSIALNGVAGNAFRDTGAQSALEGKAYSAENIAAAANAAAEGVDVLSDPFASEKYRKHLAKVYVKRALSAANNQVDDLTKVEGIGPKIAEALQAAGVKTFAQLASKSSVEIKDIIVAANSRFANANPGTWPAQAKLAAEGNWDTLKKWQDELDGGV